MVRRSSSMTRAGSFLAGDPVPDASPVAGVASGAVAGASAGSSGTGGAGRMAGLGDGGLPVDAGTAGLGGLAAISAASVARDAAPAGAVAPPAGEPDRRPAGHARRSHRKAPTTGHRLSVGQARSTRLDARENAGLSSAEFRASEAAT